MISDRRNSLRASGDGNAKFRQRVVDLRPAGQHAADACQLHSRDERANAFAGHPPGPDWEPVSNLEAK